MSALLHVIAYALLALVGFAAACTALGIALAYRSAAYWRGYWFHPHEIAAGARKLWNAVLLAAVLLACYFALQWWVDFFNGMLS
jgi:hypothetical protein